MWWDEVVIIMLPLPLHLVLEGGMMVAMKVLQVNELGSLNLRCVSVIWLVCILHLLLVILMYWNLFAISKSTISRQQNLY